MCHGLAITCFLLFALYCSWVNWYLSSRIQLLITLNYNKQFSLILIYLEYKIIREGGLGWECKRTRGRVIGTLICFTGAFVEVIYLGPFIRPSPSSSPNSNFLTTISHYLTFFKNSDNWALGSLFLACATLSISIWNIIQVT